VDPLDAAAVERATGWRVHVHASLASTNDEAARARRAGAGARTAVVALEQTAGRGREGRSFASPPGGLYASLIVAAAPGDVPGPLVAATALAAAEACEQAAGVRVAVKWPNDLWVGGRKLAGILLEGSGAGLVIVGIGINVERVPAALDPGVAAATTSLATETGREVGLAALLVLLLGAVDRRVAELAVPTRREALVDAWRARLALVGAEVRWREGAHAGRGRLVGAGLDGLEVEVPGAGRRLLRAEHVQDLRAC
jgi:BirA family biotin operon repressor/biotin-[acetyl-CoA-carboxylase] ligase